MSHDFLLPTNSKKRGRQNGASVILGLHGVRVTRGGVHRVGCLVGVEGATIIWVEVIDVIDYCKELNQMIPKLYKTLENQRAVPP